MSERPQPGRGVGGIATPQGLRLAMTDLRRMAEDPGQVRELRRAVRAFILAQDERGMRAGLLQLIAVIERYDVADNGTEICYNEGEENERSES